MIIASKIGENLCLRAVQWSMAAIAAEMEQYYFKGLC